MLIQINNHIYLFNSSSCNLLLSKWVCLVTALHHWCSRIRNEFKFFQALSLQHIYRENDSLVDILSKQALDTEEGLLIWEEFHSSQLESNGTVHFMD